MAEAGKAPLVDVEEAPEQARSCSFVNGAAATSQDPRAARFDRLTNLAVNLATFAYLPLQVPQIWKNHLAKTDAELEGLAWQGFTTGALGNLLLCTYFTGKAEWAAVRVQAIGCITNYIVIVQIYWAGFCPAPAFFAVSGVIGLGLVMPLLKVVRVLPDSAFAVWQKATTVIGMGSLFSLVGSTIVPKNDYVLGGSALAGVLLAGGLLLARTPCITRLLATLGGWLATLLFMFMPVPQILNNFLDAELAKSFALGNAILATIGNGLCVSRALFIKDAIWFTGAIWGTVVAGFVMCLSVSVAGQLEWSVLIAYSAALLLYLALVATLNGLAHRQSLARQLAFLCCSRA